MSFKSNINKESNQMDKITIVVPCYNVENNIEKCISSIKNQSYTNFEAIFVDDGSKDKTREEIQKFIEDDDRMIYAYKENGGPSSARNFGIENASGEYICFVDSDDHIEKSYLEELYGNLIENKSDIALCYFNRVYDDKISLNKVHPGFDNLIKFPAAWNKICKTSLFMDNDIRYPVGKVSEDLCAFTKLLMITQNVTIVEKPLYQYIQYSTSISHTCDDRIYDVYDIIDDLEDFACRNNIYDKFKMHLEFISIYHILIGTIYKASFRKDFTVDSIKEIYESVNDKHPNWIKNEGINTLPLFYKIYLKALNMKRFRLIYALLKLLNDKINVS